MRYKVKFVGYGYIDADSAEEALFDFDPADFSEAENISAEEV